MDKIKTLKDFGIKAFQSQDIEELEFLKHGVLKGKKIVIENCSDSIKGAYSNEYYIATITHEGKRYKTIFGGSVTYKQLSELREKSAFPCSVTLKSTISKDNFEYEYFE